MYDFKLGVEFEKLTLHYIICVFACVLFLLEPKKLQEFCAVKYCSDKLNLHLLEFARIQYLSGLISTLLILLLLLGHKFHS